MVYYEEVATALGSFEIYKLFYQKEYSFFLDSGMDPERLGRYSFIGADPFLRIQSKGECIQIFEKGAQKECTGNPFTLLKELLHRYTIENPTEFPFIGGAVGFFSYDLCHHVERLPRSAVDDLNLEDMRLGFYDGILVIDHLEKKTYAISAGLPEYCLEAAKERVASLKRLVEDAQVPDTVGLDLPYKSNIAELTCNFTPEKYCKAIEKVREYIHCGDIYQMNMTIRFSTLLNKHPLNLYDRLRSINPAPFAAYLDYGDVKILSCSPERFLLLTNGKVETRPIKGTSPRGKTSEEDAANRERLKSSIKDMAENLMIVDLMRNDIGRVCKFGSVKVPELFLIEEYPTVFHMVSTVTGELSEECGAVDCLHATFPGGSVTGAPKVRAMEIIDEMEPTCRHVYTGSIGYIGFDGNMDTSIVIRTVLVKGTRAYYQVGGGIVWDSVPENEYQECLDKGAALKRALLGI